MKGVVENVQGLIGSNRIEITDKRLGWSGGSMTFRLKRILFDELPFEKHDDVEIIIRVKNGKKK